MIAFGVITFGLFYLPRLFAMGGYRICKPAADATPGEATPVKEIGE
jgi:hypothetical protein